MSLPSPSALPSRRRAYVPEVTLADEDQTAWLVTFSDLVLQLFAFALVSAVLMAAVPTPAPGPPASTPALRPVPAPLSLPLSGLPAPVLGPREESAPIAPPAVQAALAVADMQALPDEPAVPDTPAVVDAPASAPEPDASRAELAAAGAQLTETLYAAGWGDAVKVSVGDSDLVVTLGDTIAFASGSAELLPDVAPLLGRIGTFTRTMPDFDIEVAGHTDDRPIHTGGFPSNLELSLARAARVVHELIAAAPELAGRAIATGHGEHRPVASNADEAGRARNRRVEIALVRRGPRQ